MDVFNRHGLLPRAVLLAACLCVSPLHAASIGASVNFDFTQPGNLSDPVNPANVISFSDVAELGYQLSASAWKGNTLGSLSPSTLLHSEVDYAVYGYSLMPDVSGLGACGNGNLKRCLKKVKQYGLNGSDWMLLSMSDVMKFDSLLVAPTNNKKGRVVVYSGTIDPGGVFQSQLVQENFGSQLIFAFQKGASAHTIDLAALTAGNALLIRAKGGNTSVTVKGMQATVVPLPSAIWLMGTGLVFLAFRMHRCPI